MASGFKLICAATPCRIRSTFGSSQGPSPLPILKHKEFSKKIVVDVAGPRSARHPNSQLDNSHAARWLDPPLHRPNSKGRLPKVTNYDGADIQTKDQTILQEEKGKSLENRGQHHADNETHPVGGYLLLPRNPLCWCRVHIITV